MPPNKGMELTVKSDTPFAKRRAKGRAAFACSSSQPLDVMKYVIGTARCAPSHAVLGLLIGLTAQYIGGAHVVGGAMVGTLVVHPLIGVPITA